MSNKFSVQSVPEDYVFPPDKRPGEAIIPICKTIPVIDLESAGPDDSNSTIIQQILDASQEFGFFQVIINYKFNKSIYLISFESVILFL